MITSRTHDRSTSLHGVLLAALVLTLGLLPGGRADAAWEGVTAIDPAAGVADASVPQVVLDAGGNGIAVWRQISSAVSRQRIYAAHFTTGAWGTAAPLDLLSEVGAADAPHLAADATGTAIAVWRQDSTALGRSRIYASRFDGSAWSIATAIDLGGGGLGNALAPRVAMDGSGRALAVWYQSDGGRNRVYAVRFDGATWGTPSAIDAATGVLNAFDPQVGMDATGNAIAVWQQWSSTANRYRIYASRFDGANWGTPSAIDPSATDGNAYSPDLAVNAAGRAVAVWFQDSASGVDTSIAHKRIYAAVNNGGSWGAAATLDRECDESIPDDPETEAVESCTPVLLGDAFMPRIALNDSGVAAAVWYQNDTNADRLRVFAVRHNGSAWNSAAALDAEDDKGDAFDPAVAINASGRAVAVWYQSNGSRNRIRAAIHDGTAWASPASIDLNTDVGDGFFPHAALNDAGTALAVWYQEDRSLAAPRDRIYANRYRVDTAAPLTPSTTLVDFGNTTVDATSSAKSITVTNGSDVPVVVRDLVIESGWGATYGSVIPEPDPTRTHFAISSHNCKTTLAPGASCTVSVTFTPKSASAHFAELVIAYATAGTELRVRLKGTGTAPATDTPADDTSGGGGADPWLPLLGLAALYAGWPGRGRAGKGSGRKAVRRAFSVTAG